jgi:hypothetical protein
MFASPPRLIFRYVLESGEFRIGAGPAADCRDNAADPLCASFTLQLSADYQPVCDYACAMWAPAEEGGKGTCVLACDARGKDVLILFLVYYHSPTNLSRYRVVHFLQAASAARPWRTLNAAAPAWPSSGPGTTSAAWSNTSWVSSDCTRCSALMAVTRIPMFPTSPRPVAVVAFPSYYVY